MHRIFLLLFIRWYLVAIIVPCPIVSVALTIRPHKEPFSRILFVSAESANTCQSTAHWCLAPIVRQFAPGKSGFSHHQGGVGRPPARLHDSPTGMPRILNRLPRNRYSVPGTNSPRGWLTHSHLYVALAFYGLTSSGTGAAMALAGASFRAGTTPAALMRFTICCAR